MGIGCPCQGWRISPELNPEIQDWPDGAVVFSRTSGDTHWVSAAACAVLQALHESSLTQQALRQKLALQFEMSEDDVDLNKIADVACQALLKASLIEAVGG
jgi:PqqD family protein of HPr-rel-A system